MKFGQIVRRLLPIIGISIFIYLLIKLDITKIFREIENLNWDYIFITFVLALIFFIVQTFKWFIIAKKQKVKIPFKDAFKIDIIANFYGFITPAKLGSIIRADYLRKYEGGKGKGISNFAIDKVLDLSSLFFLTILFGFIFYQSKKVISLNYLFLLIGIFLTLILFSLIFYKKEYSRFLLRFVYKRFIPEKAKEKAKLAFDSFYENIPPISFLFLVFFVNLISWVINYSIIYYVGLSIGINAPFGVFLSILPISTLVAQIPITINGLGTRELTMISLFGLFGIEAVKVFSMSILSIVIINVIPAFFAIILIFVRKRGQNQ